MSVELATAYVSILPSTKGIRGQLQKEFGDPLDDQGKKSGSSLASKFGGVAAAGMKVAGGAAIGAFGASLVKGFGRLRAIDDAQFKLQGLGHDAQTVDKIMESALNSVKGTSFGLGDAATIAASAVAAGVAPGEDLTRTLSLTGDAASIAGVSLSDMGAIFGKVGAGNRMMTQELNQLTDRGIPMLQWLAEEYGVTAAEARDMVSDGVVDFATFQKVIEENIGGAALSAGESFSGSFANMGAALGRFGATLAGPTFEAAKGWFGGITDGLDTLNDKVKPFGDLLAGALTSGVSIATAAFGHLSDWWSSYGPMIVDTVTTLGGALRDVLVGAFTSLSDWWSANGETVIGRVTDLGGALRDVLGGAFDFVSSLWTSQLEPALHTMKGLWEENADAVGGVLLTAYDNVVGALSTVGGALSTAGAWMEENTGKVRAIAAVIGFVLLPSLVRLGIASLVSGAQQTAGWLMSSTAAIRGAAVHVVQSLRIVGGWVAQGAAAIVSGAQTAYVWALYKIEAVKAAAAHVVSAARVVAGWVVMGAAAVVSGAKTAAAWIVGHVAGAAVAVASFVVAVATTVAGWVMMGIQSLLGAAKMAAAWFIALGPIGWVIAAVVAIAVLIVKNWDKVSAWTKKAWTAVTQAVSRAWTAVTGAVSRGVARVVNFFRNLGTRVRALATGLFQFYVNIWRTIISTVVGAVSAFVSRVVGFFTNIRTRITTAANSARTSVVQAFARLVTGVTTRIRSLVTMVTGIPGRIVRALGNTGRMLFNAGKAILRGLLDGIRSMFGSIGSTMSDAASRVRSFLPFSPAKEGPLSGKGHTLFAGRTIAEDLAEGITARSKLVSASAAQLAEMARQEFAGDDLLPNLASIPAVTSSSRVGGGQLNSPRGSGDVIFNGPVTVGDADDLDELRFALRKSYIEAF